MVVREDRNRVAGIIAAYLRAEIDNFALDDATMGYRGKDDSIIPIALGLWGCYDDIKRHRVSLTRAGWQGYRRCIAFLLTDLEIPRKRTARDQTLWPFQSRRDIFVTRPKLAPFELPRFDPTIHSVPIRSKSESQVFWILWIVIIVALFVGLLRFL